MLSALAHSVPIATKRKTTQSIYTHCMHATQLEIDSISIRIGFGATIRFEILSLNFAAD